MRRAGLGFPEKTENTHGVNKVSALGTPVRLPVFVVVLSARFETGLLSHGQTPSPVPWDIFSSGRSGTIGGLEDGAAENLKLAFRLLPLGVSVVSTPPKVCHYPKLAVALRRFMVRRKGRER